MKPLADSIGAGLERLGTPGVVGLGIAAFALAYAFGALQPAFDSLEQLREREARATKRTVQAAERPDDARLAESQVEAFVAWLPRADEARQELLRLHAFADKHGLQLRSGEYRALPQPEVPGVRHQVVVPLRGSYPSVRGFVTEALAEIPALALDAASLQRDAVTSAEVEVRLQFSLYTAGS